MFSKKNVKLVIDALMFLCMAALAGIGFLMKYVLLPGREAQVQYGTKVHLSLLGLERHEWGTVHLVIALVLVGLLLLHIVLNWNQVVNMYRRLIGGQALRKVVAGVFVTISLVLLVLPFMVEPEIQEFQPEGRGNGDGRGGWRAERVQLSQSSSYEIHPYS